MLRKLTAVTLLSALLLTALAACSSGKGKEAARTPKPTSSSPASPGEALAAAVAKTRGLNVKFVLDAPTKIDGVYDATKKMASMDATMNDGENVQFVVTVSDMYVSGAKSLHGTTSHVVITRMPSTKNYVVLFDPLAGLDLLSAITVVSSPAPRTFAGTLDFNKVTGTTPGGHKLVEAVLAAGGVRAAVVQFHASIDPHGYLSTFIATLPGINSGKDMVYSLVLSDLGAPVTVAVPTTNVVEAPNSAYGS